MNEAAGGHFDGIGFLNACLLNFFRWYLLDQWRIMLFLMSLMLKSCNFILLCWVWWELSKDFHIFIIFYYIYIYDHVLILPFFGGGGFNPSIPFSYWIMFSWIDNSSVTGSFLYCFIVINFQTKFDGTDDWIKSL